MSAIAGGKPMDTRSLTLSLALLLAGTFPLQVLAKADLGVDLDNLCAKLTPDADTANPPEQSRPFSARSCASCHISVPLKPSKTDLRDGATAQGLDPNKLCINSAPTGAAITAPAADGTPVGRGTTVVFSGTAVDPDYLGLGFAWSFSTGAKLTGPSVSLAIPATTTPGTVITATLTVTDTESLEAAVKPLRSVTVAGAAEPVASPDSYSIASGGTLTVAAPGVLANDSNPSGTGSLGAVLVSLPSSGTLTLAANGGFTYKPATNFTGTDQFSYRADNGTASSAAVTATITVTAAGQAPIAVADGYTTAAGTVLTVAAPGVLANDLPAGAQLSAKLVAKPVSGSLKLSSNGGFTYAPASGFGGTVHFTYQAISATVASSAATVTIAVKGITCTDKDGDGYSPEGGSCGPVDCNDGRSAVNPAARESCGDGTDNDCNGLIDNADPECSGAGCIDNLLRNRLAIDSAAWLSGKLTVTGSKATAGATVTLSDAIAGSVLGRPKVASDGSWKFETTKLATPPCRVRAVIGSAGGERAVAGAPAGCPSGPPDAPACPAEEQEEAAPAARESGRRERRDR
jgi:hypothetical protein